jgi:hypothetical protein
MAEARTMVMAATVLGRCLCYRHLVVLVAPHCPLPCNRPLCTIAIALAALAIALIIAHHPCRHRHCALHHRRCCLPAILVTITIALPPSPSLPLATLIAIAIALIVARQSCCRHHCPQ